MPRRTDLLRQALDRLHDRYGAGHLETDPLRYVHRFEEPRDQELAGLLVAAFSYGHVPQIFRNLDALLSPFTGGFRRTLLAHDMGHWERVYRGFRYRFQTRDDLLLFLWLLRDLACRAGSLEEDFVAHLHRHGEHGAGIRPALTGWVRSLRARTERSPLHGRLTGLRGIHHLLPDPATGSPCKRWNLYLRWMVRGPDGLDLGIWTRVPPDRLILPLDTHTARICRHVGLTRRSVPSWAMAEEITDSLRSLDPHDPVRYDFSIARLGILARCTRNPARSQCSACELRGICRVSTPGPRKQQRLPAPAMG